MQEFLVDTNKSKMFIKEDGKLVKIVDDVRFGKNGVCSYEEMTEGGKKTPLGTYNLGVSFGIHHLNIKYPYLKIDDTYYWVDDVNSKYYNCLVSKGNIENLGYPYIFSNVSDFSSAEHLIEYRKQYEYAVFIEYNTERVKDKGSAIFLHCHGAPYTLGCIAISRDDMEWVINFIDKDKRPIIHII